MFLCWRFLSCSCKYLCWCLMVVTSNDGGGWLLLHKVWWFCLTGKFMFYLFSVSGQENTSPYLSSFLFQLLHTRKYPKRKDFLFLLWKIMIYLLCSLPLTSQPVLQLAWKEQEKKREGWIGRRNKNEGEVNQSTL